MYWLLRSGLNKVFNRSMTGTVGECLVSIIFITTAGLLIVIIILQGGLALAHEVEATYARWGVWNFEFTYKKGLLGEGK